MITNPTGLDKTTILSNFGQQIATLQPIVVGAKELPQKPGKDAQIQLQIAQQLEFRRSIGEGDSASSSNRESEVIGLTQLGSVGTISDVFAITWLSVNKKVLTAVGVTQVDQVVGANLNAVLGAIHQYGANNNMITGTFEPFTLEVRESVIPECWEENGLLHLRQPVINNVTNEYFLKAGTRQFIYSNTSIVPVSKCSNFMFASRGETERTMLNPPIQVPLVHKEQIMREGVVAPSTSIPTVTQTIPPVTANNLFAQVPTNPVSFFGK